VLLEAPSYQFPVASHQSGGGRSRGSFSPISQLAATVLGELAGCSSTSRVDFNPDLATLGLRAPAERKGRRPLQSEYGEYRARTGDLLVANQALSQLS
jgi:hypothetical protein